MTSLKKVGEDWVRKTKPQTRSKKQNQHKYGAVKTEGYASKLEWMVGQRIRECADWVPKLAHWRARISVYEQKDLKLTAGIGLRVDFVVWVSEYDRQFARDHCFYVEAKGTQTPVWRLKRKLFLEYGDAPMIVVGRKGKGLVEIERLIPKSYTGLGADVIVDSWLSF